MMSVFLCVVLYCVSRSLALNRSPLQGVPPKCLKGLIVSEVHSESEQGPEWLWGPPIQWVSGALSLGVKRPGRKADHSPPSSAEVKE
jgi:hypothetical protein